MVVAVVPWSTGTMTAAASLLVLSVLLLEPLYLVYGWSLRPQSIPLRRSCQHTQCAARRWNPDEHNHDDGGNRQDDFRSTYRPGSGRYDSTFYSSTSSIRGGNNSGGSFGRSMNRPSGNDFRDTYRPSDSRRDNSFYSSTSSILGGGNDRGSNFGSSDPGSFGDSFGRSRSQDSGFYSSRSSIYGNDNGGGRGMMDRGDYNRMGHRPGRDERFYSSSSSIYGNDSNDWSRRGNNMYGNDASNRRRPRDDNFYSSRSSIYGNDPSLNLGGARNSRGHNPWSGSDERFYSSKSSIYGNQDDSRRRGGSMEDRQRGRNQERLQRSEQELEQNIARLERDLDRHDNPDWRLAEGMDEWLNDGSSGNTERRTNRNRFN
jgi:hypothetical protein